MRVRSPLRWPSGLQGRLVLLLICVLVPLLGLLLAHGLERRRQEANAMRDDALNLARMLAQAQRRRVEGARQFLIAVSRASDVRDLNAEACTSYVRSLAFEHRDTYNDIGVADATGRIVCHALDSGELSIADRSYFQRALATGFFAVGDYMIGRVTGIPRVAFAYPIRNTADQVTGVVFASIDLQALSNSLRVEPLSRNALLMVLDRHGALLATNGEQRNVYGNRTTPDQLRLIGEHGELVTEVPGDDGVSQVYAITPIRDGNNVTVLFATASIRRDLGMAAANERLGLELAVVVGLGILIVAAAWYGAGVLIGNPVRRLVDATSALAAGDLSARAEDVSGVREVEELGRAFNKMAERLQHRDLHLRRGQRLEAIGQLAGGVAHDFNNLLTVIIGYGQSVRSRILSGTQDAAEIDELLAASERAGKLTRQLLAFSRQQTLQPKPVQLNDIVSRMHSMLARLIGEDIRLVTVLGPDLGIVRADAAQLEQVILNLVINARDAMPGGGTLAIETMNTEIRVGDPETTSSDYGPVPPGGYSVLCITDTGVGMDETVKARIFEPFFSTKGSMGTGLGLATVYGIVKQSGGFIWCDSEPGEGTRFSFYLPHTTEPLDVAPPAAPVQVRGGHERVLVVEDEPSLRSLVATVLSKRGYEVRVTGEGAEALAWLRAEPQWPHLLVTDVVMPNMRGTALHDAAQQICPGLRVLFISGYANDGHAGPQVPPDAPFLQKPFTPAELLQKVRDSIDGAAVRHETAGVRPC